MTEGPSYDVTREFLYGAACHEAGHAAALFTAADYFGLTGRDVLTGLRIDKDGNGFIVDFHGNRVEECRGLFTMSRTWIGELTLVSGATIEVKKHYAKILEAHALILLAGPYASAINERGLPDFCLDVDMDTARSDLHKVDQISRAISDLDLPFSSFYRRSWLQLRMDAHDLVHQNWTAIEAIAARLYEKGELSGQEAYDIFASTYAAEAAAHAALPA
ncbi:hypothetical protein ACI2J5_01345 [Agrobacterium pusense]|uniref:hypothetical protein n=1 Tax=Agrobacterium pusense TaxID=648995 RepID=UPI00384D8FD2